MATGYSAEMVGVIDGTLNPPAQADGRVIGARLRSFRASFDLSLATVKKVSGDINVCFRIPSGYRPMFFIVNASVTMGATSTIALGIAGTPGKYRAAATKTTTVPDIVMPATVEDDVPLAATEEIIMTIGAADLPAAGILVIEAICSGR